MALKTLEDLRDKIQFVPFKINRNKTMPSQGAPTSITIPSVDNIKGVVVKSKEGQEDYYTMQEWEEMADSTREEIENTCSVSKTNLKIRYINGEQSIFADKQKISDKDARNIMQDLVIYNGRLVVTTDQITKLKYLRASNYSWTNPYRMSNASPIFKEWDMEEISRKENEKIAREYDAAARVSNMNAIELEMLALALSKDIPSFKRYATMQTEQLKRDLFIQMKRRPEIIDEVLDGTDYKIKSLVAKAFAEDIWRYDGKTGSVTWAESGRAICVVKSHESLLESMVRYINKDQEIMSAFDDMTEKLGAEFSALYNHKRAVDDKRVVKHKEDSVRQEFIKKYGSSAQLIMSYVDKGLISMSTPGVPHISQFVMEFDEGEEKRKIRGIKNMKAELQSGLLEELEMAEARLSESN